MICNNLLQDQGGKEKLTKKGCKSIKEANSVLEESVQPRQGDFVHDGCRKRVYNRKVKALLSKRQCKTSLRKSRSTDTNEETKGKFSNLCLFCEGQGTRSHKAGIKKTKYILRQVMTDEFQASVLRQCKKRSDKWAVEVDCRINGLQSLAASETKYHHHCYTNFKMSYGMPCQIPEMPHIKQRRKQKTEHQERPEDTVRSNAFDRVLEYLQDADTKPVTVSDLQKLMRETLSEQSVETYTKVTLKSKLISHFSESGISFIQEKGKSDIVVLGIRRKSFFVTSLQGQR